MMKTLKFIEVLGGDQVVFAQALRPETARASAVTLSYFRCERLHTSLCLINERECENAELTVQNPHCRFNLESISVPACTAAVLH